MLVKPYLKSAIALFILAGIVTYGITYFFITPKYQSTAVIFPPNTHANIHLISAGIRFGYDKEIGEQLEILNSTAVRSALIDEFDLINQYEIDTTDRYWDEKLQKEYSKNISLNRTINKSIEIVVEDKDPNQAAAMANRLVVLSDEHKSEIVMQNVRLAAEAAKKSYLDKAALIQEMTDSLEAMRQAGECVWTFGEERKSGRYQNYELQYRKELDRFMYLKEEWEQLDDLLKAEIPQSYVVSTAVASYKPVFPKKGLFSLLAACIVGLGYLVLMNLIKQN